MDLLIAGVKLDETLSSFHRVNSSLLDKLVEARPKELY